MQRCSTPTMQAGVCENAHTHLPTRFSSICFCYSSHFPPISKFGVQEVLCDLLDVEGKESLEP
jgi:hypothetical protein